MNFNSQSDQIFIKKLTEIVEKNLNNNQFGVSELAKEFGKSRSSIHRKLKSIKNQSVSQFVRSTRLEKAMDVLKEKDISVAEVAYDVGFSSPAYFNHCFHEYFGFPPGEVKKRLNEYTDPKNITENKVGNFKKERSKKIVFIGAFSLFVTAILIVLIWNSYFKKDLSIIVLPFDNFSNNPNNVYIADGIREDILNNLYRITDLRVISRTSAEQFRDSKFSARQIAKKLKVRYVLEGSIRDNGESFKISVQLIDASSIHEDHVWGDSFYRKLNDLSGVQDEISLQVVSNIKSSLSEGEITQFSKTRTENSAAYNYYLQARFLHHQGSGLNRHGFDAEGVKNCVKYYELAINEDPKFAEAYSGMAKAWFNLSAWGILGSAEGFIKARELSLKAIEIDPECAEAHCVLAAFYVWGQRNFDEGEKEFLTSIQLNPNYATSRQWYAQFLMIKGPIEESREQINIALELEPYFWVIQNLNSWIYYFEKKYNKSLEACTKAYDYNSNFSSNYWLFVLNYAKLGEGEKMKKQLQLITKNYSKSEMFNEAIQQAYDKQGINGLFLWMIDTNKNNPIPVEGLNGHPYYSAWWYALLKDKKETIFWLEKTLEEKYIPYHYFNLIATNPDFSFLSGEPGFHSVIEKAGLSKFYQQHN